MSVAFVPLIRRANADLAANRRYETIEEEVRHNAFSRLLISQFPILPNASAADWPVVS